MYILEQGLPLEWEIIWIIICIPLLYYCLKDYQQNKNEYEDYLLPLVISFLVIVFFSIISIKFDNPLLSGNGISTILLGSSTTAIVAIPALIFIKLFTGIGGFLSIGANIFSIAIAGPFIGYKLYSILNSKNNKYFYINIILTVVITEIVSIIISILQLTIAYHYPSFTQMFMMYLNMYMLNYSRDFIIFLTIEVIICIIIVKLSSQVSKYIKKE